MKYPTLGRKNCSNLRQILGYGAKTPTAYIVGKLTSRSTLQMLLLATLMSPAYADLRVGFSSEIGMSYLDRLKNPMSPSLLGLTILADQPAMKAERTIGLTRLALGLKLTSDDKTWMSVRLRPDSALRTDPERNSATQWDSRSGLQRVEARKIELVDEYSIGAKLGSARFEMGAFASVEPINRPDLLDFGLRTVGPQNFFAARCEWAFGHQPRSPGLADATNGSEVTISVFQGPGEQNDQFSSESRSGDLGPSTTNPYPGFSLGYSFKPSNTSTKWTFLTANYTRIEQSEKYSDFFFKLGLKSNISFMDRNIGMDLLARTNIERGFGGVQNEDLMQADFSWNTSVEISPERYVEVQFDYGRGQIPLTSEPSQIVQSSGYQFQLGIKAEVLNSVYASAFLGHEYRINQLSGGKTGGFGSSENPYKSSDRFLIAINYMAAGVL